MPRRCIAAGCSTKGGEGYSLHESPREESLCATWTRAVKQQRMDWKGPTAASLLCSKHFKLDCFVTEGVRYRDSIGIPTKKCLKPALIPTMFPRSIHSSSSQPPTPSQRPAYKIRKQKSVSNLCHYNINTV